MTSPGAALYLANMLNEMWGTNQTKDGSAPVDPPRSNIATVIGCIGSAALIGGSLAYAIYSPPKTAQQVMARVAAPQLAGWAALAASYLYSK